MISVNKFVPLPFLFRESCCSLVLRKILGRGSVDTRYDDVVTLVGLERDALHWAELLLSELFDLLSVDDLGSLGRVDATGLD